MIINKKRLVIVSSLVIFIILISPFGFFYVLNNGNPLTKYIAEKKVPVYLMEKGYAMDELKESHYVQPKHTINRKFYHGHYMVVFKDEPDITYYYGVTKFKHKVMQFCEKEKISSIGITDTIKDKTKHSEKDCTNSR